MAGRKKSFRLLLSRPDYQPRRLPQRSKWRRLFGLMLAGGLLVQAGGCTRSYYRKAVDEEVSEILAQKDKSPAWQIENWHIYANPRARFADDSNPDRPPK